MRSTCDAARRQLALISKPWDMRSPSRAMTLSEATAGRRRSIAKAEILARCVKFTGFAWTARPCTPSRTMIAKASSRFPGLDRGIGTPMSPRRGAHCSFSTLRLAREATFSVNTSADLLEQFVVLCAYGFNLAHPCDVPTRPSQGFNEALAHRQT